MNNIDYEILESFLFKDRKEEFTTRKTLHHEVNDESVCFMTERYGFSSSFG